MTAATPQARLYAALHLACTGRRVFPVHEIRPDGRCSCGRECDSPGKHPIGSLVPHGAKDATSDVLTVRKWWTAHPTANIAVATDGLAVLDLDKRPDRDGADAFARLEDEHGRIPECPVTLTPTGGRHLWLAENGSPITNSAGKLGPGIDVRGRGGYVLVPPSNHIAGCSYAWDMEAHPDDVAIPTVPKWIEAKLTEPTKTAERPRLDTAVVLSGVEDGTRENSLFRLASKLRRADVPEHVAARLVCEAAAACTPPYPATEARARVERAYRLYVPAPSLDEPSAYDGDHGPASALWMPATLEGVTDPNAGRVEYVVDGLIPAGAVSIVGASWKSGKTLALYSLAVCAISGRRVFDRYAVAAPVRVGIFQLEMPLREDHRRFRRLALGLGMYPEEIPGYVTAGMLVHYNRPRMNLARPADVAQFCRIIRDADLRLVFVDSLIRAFAGSDINDNAVVPELFASAFADLTSEGRAIMLAHHKRKAPQGGKPDDDKSSLLASQAWGASADRVFLLDRIPDKPGQKDGASFRCRLHLPGSWTPEADDDVLLEVRDAGEGTTVRAILESSPEAAATLTKAQRAALALAKLVRDRVTILQTDALALVVGETSIGLRTVESGLAYAKSKGWIDARADESGADNRNVLTPGAAITEAP